MDYVPAVRAAGTTTTIADPERGRAVLRVDAVIPALDEEGAIGGVIRGLLAARLGGARLGRVVVADNGSIDRTAEVARAAGAVVVREPRRGYGAACLAALEHLARQPDPPDVVLFLDGDGADDPADLPALLGPLARGEAALVIGSRTRQAEVGALTPQQRAGNAVAVAAIALLYGRRYSDLGPLRAIRYEALRDLGMVDLDYGWTVEMQVKALRRGLPVVEVPVRYHRRRAGRSKVSGTLRGTIGAGWKILGTIVRHAR
jgi:glycosyltransferase involved in cell wall biosynthesis